MDPEEANKFINSLVKNLQVLCHGHVSFSNSIQVIGHLYLNVDSTVNIDYIVNEKVCKNDTSSTVFVSNSYHSEPHKKIPHDIGQNQNKNRPAEDLEASVDLTDDGTVVQRLLPINFRSNASKTPCAIHPAYRDQGSTHHSRKSRKPFHNIEASQAKSPRMSLAPSPVNRSVNRNDSNIKEEKHSMNLNSSQLQENVRMENSQQNEFANSNVPEAAETSVTDNNTASSIQNENQDGSPFELSLQNIKNEPGEEMGQNSLFEQQLESNSSQPIQHSDASADEEFFSGLRDKTLGVFPVALHASDQVLGSDNFSGLSQPSTSSFKDEMGDLDPGSGASHLDSTLNMLRIDLDDKTKTTCPKCGLIFHKRSVNRHIQDKHRFVSCPKCAEAFFTRGKLVSHVTTCCAEELKGIVSVVYLTGSSGLS